MQILKAFKWLYPGMWVKRWIALVIFGIIMISMGFVMVLLEERPEHKTISGVIIIVGIIAVVTGVKRIIKSVVTIFLPEREGELVDKVFQKRILERGLRVVAIGGGTGLSMLLHGLKEHTSNITAIVTVADDGGSSGRLRQDFGVLPPGDIRNCLVALADAEPLMRNLFQFRFEEGSELKGHSFGNLFITAMTKVTGDFDAAIRESSKVLAIRGRVLPSTLDKVTLAADHMDGSKSFGESKIAEAKSPVKKVYLAPRTCQPTHEAVEAIRKADVIILGPGSLYTSIIPNLLVEGISKEILNSKAVKIYICNVMTQRGETDGYRASDHLRSIEEHSRPGIVDYCVVNTAKVSDGMLEKYKLEGAYPVLADIDALKTRCKVVEDDLISTKDFVRHNAARLAKVTIDLVLNARKDKTQS